MILSTMFRIASNVRKVYLDQRRKKKTQKRLGLDITDRFYTPSNTVESAGNRTYSVVSAVYGVENYLDEMLASLLRQTLEFKKQIQVILVDDGSVDKSGEICEQWAAAFPDNIRVIHKKMAGSRAPDMQGCHMLMVIG